MLSPLTSLAASGKRAVRSYYRKSSIREEYEVSEMVERDNATVHGVIVNLCPIKCSKNNPAVNYFNAKIGESKLRSLWRLHKLKEKQ